MDLLKSNTSSLEITKCNELDTLVEAQRKLIDNNATGLRNLKKELRDKK